MRLVLIQARRLDDPMREHEIDCFARHLGVPLEEIEVFQILADPEHKLDAILNDPRAAIFIGGSGDFSISQPGPPALDAFVTKMIPQIANSGRPVFGSCWGFHALAKGLGGRVVRTGDSEVGTFQVGVRRPADPLFNHLPDHFDAQMGHKDWVTQLPPGAISLAYNEASPHQAIRMGDLPVYGVQFHAELTIDDNKHRFMFYIEHYGGMGDVSDQLMAFRPSPMANTLLERFREIYCDPMKSGD